MASSHELKICGENGDIARESYRRKEGKTIFISVRDSGIELQPGSFLKG
jgi:hypothetical protein